jgi:SAM-dependent methyltransferase
MSPTNRPPDAAEFEPVACYHCGSARCRPLVVAQDDLTGKPGNFRFVTCLDCGLAYQNPRLRLERIKDYYDDEYIAHRKKTDWGVLTPLYNRAMQKLDRDKVALVRRYHPLGHGTRVLDVGCGAGTFLAWLRERHGCAVTGVDFKDLSALPSLRGVDFRCGLLHEQDLPAGGFDLITMWHFLEHDYDPVRSLTTALALLAPAGRLIVEVPRLDSVSSWLFRERWPGLQAPQHTLLFSKRTLVPFVQARGWDVTGYLPYGAFPPYFYLFAGVAFKFRKGKGIDLATAIYPYFLGQLLLTPVLLFGRHLNLAMQTVVCRKPG